MKQERIATLIRRMERLVVELRIGYAELVDMSISGMGLMMHLEVPVLVRIFRDLRVPRSALVIRDVQGCLHVKFRARGATFTGCILEKYRSQTTWFDAVAHDAPPQLAAEAVEITIPLLPAPRP